MRKRIIFTTLLSIISTMPCTSSAATCDGLDQTNCKATAGCGFDSTTTKCKICSSGYWSGKDTNCQNCPTNYPNTNAEGATFKGACYKACETQRLTNSYGTIAPDVEKLFYEEDNKGKTCQYTKLTNITCDDGYHTTTTRTGTGTDGDLRNIGNLCIANTMACDAAGLDGCNEGGTIVGNATWNDSTKQWTYTDCRCRKSISSIPDINGTAAVEYAYASGSGQNTKWGTATIVSIEACNPGYYQKSNTDMKCTAAGTGYYADGKSKERKKCPAPSTTINTQTAASIKNCHIKGGSNGTKFCDKNGCFTLPDKIVIPHR